VGDAELRACIDSPWMHQRDDRLHADLSGRRVAAATVLNEGQRSADVARKTVTSHGGLLRFPLPVLLKWRSQSAA
jgi:hypothetical protein